MEKRKVIIADDQKLIAEGIKQLLQQYDNIEVVEIVTNSLLIEETIFELKPDVLLLDLNMPHKNGFDVLEEIRPVFPDLIIAILSTYDNLTFVKKARELGANAYLSKDTEVVELQNVILNQHGLDFYMSDDLSHRQKNMEIFSDHFPLLVELTQREKEILKLIAHGNLTKEISDRLNISISTVKTHRKNLYKKLNVNSISQLIKIAYESGIL